jgi:hypothetical protein
LRYMCEISSSPRWLSATAEIRGHAGAPIGPCTDSSRRLERNACRFVGESGEGFGIAFAAVWALWLPALNFLAPARSVSGGHRVGVCAQRVSGAVVWMVPTILAPIAFTLYCRSCSMALSPL